ncbi:hypothetical protein [Streptomyces rubradiris]|uniref:Uncharacterized protein n=1 Tax=Streptomyces rubradiris TaxID=285531 RepID=A0ABQ3RAG1_STRRR|nr:hypothetical protein [Streptomyces rubradiris]GHH31441.1 hypothetical protein GCM10018792_79190 [Streptomyces rubradiris]GHI52837.1 hypothetical protein Srubr_26830 [Streptomyces rubradiris]
MSTPTKRAAEMARLLIAAAKQDNACVVTSDLVDTVMKAHADTEPGKANPGTVRRLVRKHAAVEGVRVILTDEEREHGPHGVRQCRVRELRAAEQPSLESDYVGVMPQYAQYPGVAEALEILRAAEVPVATVPARKVLYREWHSPQGPQGAFIWPGAGRTLEVSWFIDGADDERGMRSRGTRTVRAARNQALDDVAGAFRRAGWTVWRVLSRKTATRRDLHVDVTPPAPKEEPPAVITEEDAEALVAEFGIGEGDLDEAVYDAANEDGADEYNGGAHPELSDDDAYKEVHNAADVRASSVNNQGATAQVQFLAEFCGTVEALRSLLRDVMSPPATVESPAVSADLRTGQIQS